MDKKKLESSTIYSVFVRNHSEEGTFNELEKDLKRIKELGTDILWLLPIYPTGQASRKGKDGSPYAIRDYRQIAKEMGSQKDLERLVQKAHEMGMKVIVDIVYNHTSPDSFLAKTHPDWFYLDENGHPASIVEEWSDIVDLNYDHPELADYQIETLKQWSDLFDGFRCDVANRVPVKFWKEARNEVEKEGKDLIWLAESVHYPFVKFVRDQGRYCASDCELYEAFDLEYDYDIWPYFEDYLEGAIPLSSYARELERQESLYPKDALKMRCLENHDQKRLASYASTLFEQENWLAFEFFQKGPGLIYHGQEFSAKRQNSIFDQDVIEKDGSDLSKLIARLSEIHKKLPFEASVHFYTDDKSNTLTMTRFPYAGIFQLGL